MPDKGPVLSDLDFGGCAEHYASRPQDEHFKGEVYPLFINVLSRLPDGARALDIGAGPGHLAVRFYAAHPDSGLQFVLLDSSRELLRIAAERVAGRGAATLVRSFNMDGWEEGVGEAHAIVSNNAIFNVRPERLDGFYKTCHGLLAPAGILLNQQAFAYSDGESPYGDAAFRQATRELLQSLFPGRPDMTQEQQDRLVEEHRRTKERQEKALAEARAAGVEILPDQSGYQFLTVERHLGSMRAAGLACGCIWRKREFAVLCGVKPE